MDIIWGSMVLLGVIFAIAMGKITEVSEAFLQGGRDAVQLCVTMAGIMAMWTGPVSYTHLYDLEIINASPLLAFHINESADKFVCALNFIAVASSSGTSIEEITVYYIPTNRHLSNNFSFPQLCHCTILYK